MAYQATWVNRIVVPGGVGATVLLHDDAASNPYPDRRIDHKFRGKTLANLTNAFLLSVAKADVARIIEEVDALRDMDTLNALILARWNLTVVPALATFVADVQARLAANNIDPTTIRNQILSHWASYNVDGIISNPTVTVSLTAPQASATQAQIGVSN